ncbi:outer membrane protein assembly factor BamC [Leeia sp. TBRC 13508]|uniref:Outer membrane protein assembly factor BamC n=1 Tax=Leeia speluncae TaxID=2884804 RepID=A0ABS8D1B7_9NEIS|nr:outer membrane protein assembly factor BamC [Leeia speluncae]MCB6181988.1 outer membrane protein assembly factor BamC [Leeia speluncae]
MRSSKKLIPSCLLLALLLSGCSSSLFQGKKIDYRSAGEAPGLDVPPDLSKPSYDNRFAMPEVNRGGTASFNTYADGTQVAATSTDTTILPKVNKVAVEKTGNTRWLVVDATPDQLWLPIKDFWQELGFIIKVDEPTTGIMETDWAENRANIPDDIIRNTFGKWFDSAYSTDERDKFRTRMERRADGKTEIYISHRGMYEAYVEKSGNGTSSTVWQPRPAEPELEAEMMNRLMIRLGMEENAAKQALEAKQNASIQRAKIVKADNSAYVQLDEGFDRAWRRVGLVLDRSGFTVVDRNRTDGVYFVSYKDEQKPESSGDGWFSWLWGSNDDKKKPEVIQYRIAVRGDGDNASKVLVQDKNGAAETSEIGKKLTGILFEQLR